MEVLAFLLYSKHAGAGKYGIENSFAGIVHRFPIEACPRSWWDRWCSSFRSHGIDFAYDEWH